MKKVFFVHQDASAAERQSDGVEFCVIPEFRDDKIYFYCSEYMVFWKAVDEVGDFEKSYDFKLKQGIIPALIEKICEENLCRYIDTVKEYDIENGKLMNISYIHLQR